MGIPFERQYLIAVNYSELKHRASNDCLVVTFFFDKQPVALTAFAASVLRGLAFALG